MKSPFFRSIARGAFLSLGLVGAGIGAASVVLADATTGIVVTSPTASEASSWRGIAYGNGIYVAVAQSGTNRVMTSTDGTTWTSRTQAEANEWASIPFGNDIFVAGAPRGTEGKRLNTPARCSITIERCVTPSKRKRPIWPRRV